MAIQSNSSDVEVVGGGIPLFTGIAPVRVVAINPTLGELAAIGVNMQNEPTYLNANVGGDTYNKLAFWLQNEEHNFLSRMEILVKPEEKVSRNGDKKQWVNKFGQVAYSAIDTPASNAYEWFKADGVRPAYVGEETLINFVKAWANVPNDGECTFSTISSIMAGDVAEIKQLITTLKDNKLRVLLGVKSGKYQQVYMKHFGRLKPKNDSYFVRALNQDYGSFNAEYNADLKLQSYSPEVVESNETPTKEVEVNEDFGW